MSNETDTREAPETAYISKPVLFVAGRYSARVNALSEGWYTFHAGVPGIVCNLLDEHENTCNTAVEPAAGLQFTKGCPAIKYFDDDNSITVWRPDTTTSVYLTYHGLKKPDIRVILGTGGTPTPTDINHLFELMKYDVHFDHFSGANGLHADVPDAEGLEALILNDHWLTSFAGVADVRLATPPDETRPHGVTVWGLYNRLQLADITPPSWICSRNVQYYEPNFVKWRARTYTYELSGYFSAILNPVFVEGAYHGFMGLYDYQQALNSILRPPLIFDAGIIPTTPGLPLMGFFYLPSGLSQQEPYGNWKIVLRNQVGCTIIDTGVPNMTGSWYRFRIERDQTTGALSFYIQQDGQPEVVNVVSGANPDIPIQDAVQAPMWLGKVHYMQPNVTPQALSLPGLSYIDLDASEFVEAIDIPYFPQQQEKMAAMKAAIDAGRKLP